MASLYFCTDNCVIWYNMIVFDFQRPIIRYNVDNDYNYREELVESFISESNGGISVFMYHRSLSNDATGICQF